MRKPKKNTVLYLLVEDGSMTVWKSRLLFYYICAVEQASSASQLAWTSRDKLWNSWNTKKSDISSSYTSSWGPVLLCRLIFDKCLQLVSWHIHKHKLCFSCARFIIKFAQTTIKLPYSHLSIRLSCNYAITNGYNNMHSCVKSKYMLIIWLYVGFSKHQKPSDTESQ